jgi:hypothetical protein
LLMTVLRHREAAGSILDESFQVHASASVDVLTAARVDGRILSTCGGIGKPVGEVGTRRGLLAG